MAQVEESRRGKPYNIILEVAVFAVMLGLTLTVTPMTNIILYRTCIHSLKHSVDDCHGFLSPDATNSTKNVEKEVQKYSTYVSTVKMFVESLAPAILTLFVGVWSDTHGRKPLIVWPLFGIALSAMLNLVYCMMENLGPWWTILAQIPFSITGGIRVLLTGLFCYINDVTASNNISLRMTTMDIAASAGSIVGSLVCAHLVKAVGNVYLLLIVAAILVFAYVLTNIFLQESLTGVVPGRISSVLKLSLIKEMVTECFKQRPYYLRTQIILLTIANSCNVFIMYGLKSLEYMYTREKLHWALNEFNQFSAATDLISSVGSIIGVTVIQKWCRISDLAFSMISFMSSSTEYVIKGLALASWQMYLGSGISVFGSLSVPLIRSFLAKTLPTEDIAKIFALMSAIEGVLPLISPFIYNSLYSATIYTFPGSVYLLSSSITGFCAMLLMFVFYLRWRAPAVLYQPVESNMSD